MSHSSICCPMTTGSVAATFSSCTMGLAVLFLLSEEHSALGVADGSGGRWHAHLDLFSAYLFSARQGSFLKNNVHISGRAMAVPDIVAFYISVLVLTDGKEMLGNDRDGRVTLDLFLDLLFIF